jgi:hypothetical protein
MAAAVAGLGGCSAEGVGSVSDPARGSGGARAEDAAAADAVPLPQPTERETMLRMDPIELQAGEDAFVCQSFANPFGGRDTFVHAFESEMGGGGHHLLLFHSTAVTDSRPAESCAPFEFATTAYGSQRPRDRLRFPDGVATRLPGDAGLRIQVHYFNAGDEVAAVDTVVRLRWSEGSSAPIEAGNFYVTVKDILVPAKGSATVSETCTVPFDLEVLAVTSHMHRFGVGFRATLDGRPLVGTAAQEPEIVPFSPALESPAGTRLGIACDYRNPEAFDVRGGSAFATEEMCLLSAYFYPLPKGAPGTFDLCQPGAAAEARP